MQYSIFSYIYKTKGISERQMCIRPKISGYILMEEYGEKRFKVVDESEFIKLLDDSIVLTNISTSDYFFSLYSKKVTDGFIDSLKYSIKGMSEENYKYLCYGKADIGVVLAMSDDICLDIYTNNKAKLWDKLVSLNRSRTALNIVAYNNNCVYATLSLSECEKLSKSTRMLYDTCCFKNYCTYNVDRKAIGSLDNLTDNLSRYLV